MTANPSLPDPFHARDTFETGSGRAESIVSSKLEDAGLTKIGRLPYSIRVLLEAVLRNCDGFAISEDDVKNLAGWNASRAATFDVPFKPARVVLQDFTGVPAVVDLAAMRSAMRRLGGDPKRINPLVPVDLVIDHSVQVDFFGSPEARAKNVAMEFQRNGERYELLRWGQKAFKNFRVVPPSVGIVHQVNLEFLAKCVFLREDAAGPIALPDTLVGADSHTTMINGLGVLGWGVGGIEAEAVMLGQPLYMLAPEVIGFELSGQLPPGATATDLVLTLTQILRKEGVVNKFVEFFGPAMNRLKVADRALVANMAPEYGATMGFFPIDEQTLAYLRETGRSDCEVQLVERYAKEQRLFRSAGNNGHEEETPEYNKTLRLNLSTIEPCVAGPKRPQDRVPLGQVKSSFRQALTAPPAQRGFGLAAADAGANGGCAGRRRRAIGHGAVVIAAITSCTNTSNPEVMLAAGLLAKKAVERGLKVPPYVKASLAPGSRVVTDYLHKAGLDKPLEQLGFHTVGYGCTTCIGNSGPLPEPVAAAVRQGNLVAAAVLSGNRNFEGRINPLVKASYLASPPLVVAYALAGATDLDLTAEPLGMDRDGRPVYLKDVWPSARKLPRRRRRQFGPECFAAATATSSRATTRGTPCRSPRANCTPGTRRARTSRSRRSFSICPPNRGRSGRSTGAGVGGVGRFRDHRPHFARRLDRRVQPGGKVLAGARRRPGGLQQLRFAAGQRSRDDPRHASQHPPAQPLGAGHGRRRHPSFARRRADDDLRCGNEIQGRGCAAGDPGGHGIRHRQQPRLGRQGNLPLGRPRRPGPQLRTHPPQQPGRHGPVAPGASRPVGKASA